MQIIIKEIENMESKYNNLFNKELLLRAISVIFFIPIILIPIYFGDIILFVVYIFLTSIIVTELNFIKLQSKKKILVNIYLIATIFTFLTFIFLVITSQYTKLFLFEIVLTIWLFDTFSYLGGKLIGGKKLIPSISSGKTISGLLVGIIFTIVIIKFLSFLPYNSESTFLLTICTIIFAFLGDVVVSILKRSASMKDSGTIMPGHGGLLDRFDSFIGVFFVFGLIKYFI